MRVTVRQLREHLPDILDRAVKDDQPCIIERGGETYAVIVSARQWRRHTIGKQLDRAWARVSAGKRETGTSRRAAGREQAPSAHERRELNSLLRDSERVMLRRAEAMDR